MQNETPVSSCFAWSRYHCDIIFLFWPFHLQCFYSLSQNWIRKTCKTKKTLFVQYFLCKRPKFMLRVENGKINLIEWSDNKQNKTKVRKIKRHRNVIQKVDNEQQFQNDIEIIFCSSKPNSSNVLFLNSLIEREFLSLECKKIKDHLYYYILIINYDSYFFDSMT